MVFNIDPETLVRMFDAEFRNRVLIAERDAELTLVADVYNIAVASLREILSIVEEETETAKAAFMKGLYESSPQRDEHPYMGDAGLPRHTNDITPPRHEDERPRRRERADRFIVEDINLD